MGNWVDERVGWAVNECGEDEVAGGVGDREREWTSE